MQPELSMERLSSIVKRSRYVEGVLGEKNERTVSWKRPPLKVFTIMKRNEALNGAEPEACSTMKEKKNSVAHRSIDDIVSVSFLFNKDINDCVRNPKFRTRKVLSERDNLILIDYCYGIKSSSTDVSDGYDLFLSEEMRYMKSVWRDFVNLTAAEIAFCSFPRFTH